MNKATTKRKPAIHTDGGRSNAARETRRSDGVVGGGHGSAVLRVSKLWPDAGPVVGAQQLPGDFLAALALDEHAKFSGGLAAPAQDLVEVGISHAASLGEDLAVSRFEVHNPTVAFRYVTVKRFATANC